MSHLLFEDSPPKSLQPNELLNGFANAARDNPLPAALLGAGLLWVLGRDIAARFRGTTDSESDTNAPAPASDEALTPSQKVGRGIRGAQRGVADVWEQQPLIVGAVGLAIGAGLASLFPTTAVEAEMLQPQAERLAAEFKTRGLGHFPS
jgi:hypothetical protein